MYQPLRLALQSLIMRDSSKMKNTPHRTSRGSSSTSPLVFGSWELLSRANLDAQLLASSSPVSSIKDDHDLKQRAGCCGWEILEEFTDVQWLKKVMHTWHILDSLALISRIHLLLQFFVVHCNPWDVYILYIQFCNDSYKHCWKTCRNFL